MTVLVVTGTGTDIGKTITTAALAATLPGDVAVVKPAQTGVERGAPGDLAEVTRLTGVTDVHELGRYPDPLSPHQAAEVSGLPPVARADVVELVESLDESHDWVLVEGAGGLLVPFDSPLGDPWTLVDLGHDLATQFVVVVAPGLGTLNHTLLTTQHLEAQGLEYELVIGSWPAEPDLAMRMNVEDLHMLTPRDGLAGVMPAGMAAMRDFPEQARAALAPRFGGTLDWRAFRLAQRH